MRLPRMLAVAVSAVLATGGTAVGLVSASGSSSRPLASATSPAGKPVLFASGATAPTPRAAARDAAAGLSLPAAGVPISETADPVAAPAVRTGSLRGRPAVIIPGPTFKSLPPVDALSKAVTPDAVVMLSSPLSAAQTAGLKHLKGVTATAIVDTGTVGMGGAPVVAFGVDPDTFRAFTPPASASSDQLWRYLKGGSLVSSYDMAGDRDLKPGTTSVITPASDGPAAAPVEGWLGAIASIGLPGVDLLVDRAYSPVLGLTPDSGVVVAAPSVAGPALQAELQKLLPDGAVELLYPGQLPSVLPGNTLGSATRQRILSAALSRVGLPYVWGGAGPSDFDCSGLVQWSYRQAGILMPRVAAEQFLTGDHIPLADALPGDLIFWAYDPSDPTYVDHVAIYLGNGLMVVAPHTGTDVQIASVPLADFAGVVQVVLAP